VASRMEYANANGLHALIAAAMELLPTRAARPLAGEKGTKAPLPPGHRQG